MSGAEGAPEPEGSKRSSVDEEGRWDGSEEAEAEVERWVEVGGPEANGSGKGEGVWNDEVGEETRTLSVMRFRPKPVSGS